MVRYSLQVPPGLCSLEAQACNPELAKDPPTPTLAARSGSLGGGSFPQDDTPRKKEKSSERLQPFDVLFDAPEGLIDNVLNFGQGRQQGRFELGQDFVHDEITASFDTVGACPIPRKSGYAARRFFFFARSAQQIGDHASCNRRGQNCAGRSSAAVFPRSGSAKSASRAAFINHDVLSLSALARSHERPSRPCSASFFSSVAISMPSSFAAACRLPSERSSARWI